MKSDHSKLALRMPNDHAGALAAGLAMGGLLVALPAFAQTPIAAASGELAASTEVTQVMVTARKKKERLLEVPLAVTAVSAKTLEEAGITNVQELTRLMPGLTINTSGAEATITPSIRGLTNLNGGAGDPNVAVFLDGVYIANPSAISIGMIDMERVEVIKGPVGALYGRNAYAGVINYVSKKPSDYLDGGVTATYGDKGRRGLTGTISGPIKQGMLNGRLTLSQDELGYTYRDLVNGLEVGGYTKKDAQASFELTPTRALDINGAIYRGDDFFQQSAASYVTGNCGETIASGVNAGQRKQYCGEISQQQPIEVANLAGSGASGNKREVTSANLRGSYDAGAFDASVILGYNKVDQYRFNDFTGYRNGIPFQTTTGRTVNISEVFGGQFSNDDKSAELRIASDQSRQLRWATGLYYFDGTRSTATFVGLDAAPLNGEQLAFAAARPYLSTNGQWNPATTTSTRATERVKSEFLSADYDIIAALTASAEFRHTVQSKTQQSVSATGVGGTLFSNDFGYNNYRGTLRYKLNGDAMVYGSVANGTKGGGFNAGANQTGTYAYELTYQPETNKTFELGAKSRFLGGKVQGSLAVYQVDSNNLQINGPSDNPAVVSLLVKNFGKVKTRGFEMELAARVTQDFSITAGLGYVDAEFGAGTYDFSAADVAGCAAIPSCAPRIVTVPSAQGSSKAMNLAGMAPPQVSRITFNTGAQLTHTFGADWKWSGRVDYRLETKQYNKFGNGNPLGANWLGDRHLVNLHTTLNKNAWTAGAYINNLFNDRTPDAASNNVRLNDFVGQMVSYIPAGMTFGVTLAYKY